MRMIRLLVICLLLPLVWNEATCTCSQLKSENDCKNFKPDSCVWNKENTSTPCSIAEVSQVNSSSFCNQFTQQGTCTEQFYYDGCTGSIDSCLNNPKVYPCAWVDKQCQIFPGCSAFNKVQASECQYISKYCTTDGIQCIKLAECTEYRNQVACDQISINNKYCYWDGVSCKSVESCDKAPTSLKAHDQCFQTLSSCTVDDSRSGGCQNLKQSCSDYKSEGSCKINSNMTECTWNNNSCQEKACSTAPSNIQTAQECEKYMPNCTYINGAGCTEKINCGSRKEPITCIGDTNNQKCWFNSKTNECVEWICKNAPLDYQSLEQCQSFKQICAPKSSGIGCTENTGCSALTTNNDCKISADGASCYWNLDNSKCVEKTCANAPESFTTYEQCSNYLSSCALDADNYGCVIKTCENAPKSLKSNEECEKYLPNNNCITQSGGGCRTNEECLQINAEKACVRDKFGAECFWEEDTSDCITKSCNKAPEKFVAQGCNTFMTKCQLNQSKTGCEENICTNQETQDTCKTDYAGNSCRWTSQCVEKICENASTLIASFAECNKLLPTCTLANSGFGCMQLPLKCESIITKEGCRYKTSIKLNSDVTISECDWYNNQCVDKSCETAPLSLQSNAQCQAYQQGCYLRNERRGCMKLPDCSKRGLIETCEIEGLIDCIWNAESSKCLPKSCYTANIKGSKDVIQSFSFMSCIGYILPKENCSLSGGKGCCTLNNEENGCMEKPDNCTNLSNPNNCQFNALKAGGDCYWDSTVSKCVANQCSAIKLKSFNHEDCYMISNSRCTVNVDASACENLRTDCPLYKSQDSCRKDSHNNNCIWFLTSDNKTFACVQKGCDNIFEADYQTYEECQLIIDTCTVIPRVNQLGCIPTKDRCYDYKYDYQCSRTKSNKTNINNCIWNGDRCWDISGISCSQIKLTTYTTQACENVAYYCKSDNISCIPKKCIDYTTVNGKTGGVSVTAYEDCVHLDPSCTINKANNGCAPMQQNCPAYTDQTMCNYAANKVKCLSNGSQCYPSNQACNQFTANSDDECKAYRAFCKYPPAATGQQTCIDRTCEDKVSTNLTHSDCQTYSTVCTATVDKLKCITILQTCAQYGTSNNCVRSQQDNCYWISGTNQCVGLGQTSADGVVDYCSYISNPKTFQNCQDQSKNCSINRGLNTCVQIKSACSLYTKMDSCYKASSGYCAQSAIDSNCQQASQIDCEKLYLGQSVTYTNELCMTVNPKCTNNGSTGCQIKTCANAIVNSFTHDSCNTWLSTCTVNPSKNGCQTMKEYCKQQNEADCIITAYDGECIYNSSSKLCVQKTCYNSPGTETTDVDCYNYMPQCTIAQKGGCQVRADCINYFTELQCKTNSKGELCFWNPSNQQCVDYSCGNIEKTALFNNHIACFSLNNVQLAKKQYSRCTVDLDTSGNPTGCKPLGTCSSYTNEKQCVVSVNGVYCFWNTDNADFPKCEEKTCESAPKTIQSDEECKNYQLNINTKYSDQCTVDVQEITDGVYVLGGCRQLTDCIEYKRSEQCLKDQDKKACKWYNNECFLFECSSAPSSIKSASDCESFKPECTLATSGSGCTKKDPKCKTFNKDQCVKSINGDECFWDQTKNECIQLTCTNQPTDSTLKCTSLPNCLDNTGKQCVSKKCSDFPLTTDDECKVAANMNGVCTTDGVRCIRRTTCEMALVKDACKNDQSGVACIWYDATATSDAYCATSKCSKADSSYVTDYQCQNISLTCTAKAQGGCKEKTTCSSIEKKDSCTQSIEGVDCKWNNNKCEEYECKNLLKGQTHFDCQKQKSSCTISSSGQCTSMLSSCELYTIEAACVETLTNQTCQWVAAYSDAQYPNGKCVPYKSCESIPLTADTQCKKISKYCTASQQSCTAIKLCQDTSNSSCISGSDGVCMLTLTSSQASTQTCQKFTKCEDIKLKTHQECQNANNGCTTDGSLGCIDLQKECGDYKIQLACNITKSGKKTDSEGAVTSTGKCIYGNGNCRSEICEDLGSGTTHNYCYQKLKNCTSDGTNCATMKDCENYESVALCNNGRGSNGMCYWSNPSVQIGKNCKLQTCTDVQKPSSDICQAIKNCIYDGTKCIFRVACENYLTQTACQQGSQNYEACYWNSTTNKCKTAQNCTLVASDSAACNSDANCFYSTTGCLDKNCQNLYTALNICTNYRDRLNKVHYCQKQNEICQAITSLTGLDKDQCLVNSQYTYTFINGSCSVCNPIQIVNNTNNTTTNPTNNETTSTEGYYLGINFLWVALLTYN